MHSNPRNVLTISITYYTQKYSLEHLYDRVKKVLFKTISWIARALRASHTHGGNLPRKNQCLTRHNSAASPSSLKVFNSSASPAELTLVPNPLKIRVKKIPAEAGLVSAVLSCKEFFLVALPMYPMRLCLYSFGKLLSIQMLLSYIPQKIRRGVLRLGLI